MIHAKKIPDVAFWRRGFFRFLGECAGRGGRSLAFVPGKLGVLPGRCPLAGILFSRRGVALVFHHSLDGKRRLVQDLRLVRDAGNLEMAEPTPSLIVVGRIMGNQVAFVPVPDEIIRRDRVKRGLSRRLVAPLFHPARIAVVPLVIVEAELLLLSDGLQEDTDNMLLFLITLYSVVAPRAQFFFLLCQN